MDVKKKIIIIVAFSLLLSASLIVMLNRIFDKIEDQLVQKCRIEALVGARVAKTFMELMIHTKQLTPEQLNDTDYKLIEGTNPKQYHTKYDSMFDGAIQKFQDEFLKDEDVAFAVLFDRNGYVPTHNTKYSLPPSSDYKNNLLNSRSKRNFSIQREITEILRYRADGTVMYPYHRDTGEIMWNVGAPVANNAKHWGSFVIGISLQRMDIIKNQMIIIIVTIIIINLSFTLLIILAVIPRKYFLPAQTEEKPVAAGGKE